MNPDPTQKLVSPSAERNKDVILDVLREILADTTQVLEVASGTGQHAVHIAGAMPHLTWQPTDHDPAHLPSIEAWRADSGLDNVRPAQPLDATVDPWPFDGIDAIVNINMIHISPWEVCLGLLDGAERHLLEGGVLYLYGPYKVGGRHTAPSNESFEAWLKSQDPSWGVRNLDDVALEARRRGLHLVKTVKMPANNFSVIFRKTAMVALEDET